MGPHDAQRLAERHLAGELPQRWQHVQAVAAEAGRLCIALAAAGCEGLDRDVILSSSWLHDVGYSTELLDSGFHPLDGARYLREQGWDRQVCGLVAYHTDSARQADWLGLKRSLESEFADVRGIARDVVWTADATTGPSGQSMTISQRIADVTERYGTNNLVSICLGASRPSLQAAADRVTARIAQTR